MPKYYCDYCDTYLTHDSPSVRKTHCTGRKHKENVKSYYQRWLEEQAQSFIDATTAAFKAGKIQSGQFANAANPASAMIPPSPTLMGPVRPPVPGQPLPAIAPPPIGCLPGPVPAPMPVMPPAPIPPFTMMPGIRPPVAPIGPMMPIAPVPAPTVRNTAVIPQR